MQHSNCYSNVKNINYSITRLNMGLFNDKIGITNSLFFLFYRNFQSSLLARLFRHPPSPYLILPNVPTPPSPAPRLPPLIGLPVYSGPKSIFQR